MKAAAITKRLNHQSRPKGCKPAVIGFSSGSQLLAFS